MLEKENIKYTILFILLFIVGLMSVSIANFLGGYYCYGAAVCSFITLLLVNDIANKNLWESSKNEIIMVLVITTLEIIFFVVNDLCGVDVYVKNQLSFWGILVMTSQLASAVAIMYYLIKNIYASFKKEAGTNFSDFEPIKKEELEEVKPEKEKIESDHEDLELKNSGVEELKQIPRDITIEEAPFMEEEK